MRETGRRFYTIAEMYEIGSRCPFSSEILSQGEEMKGIDSGESLAIKSEEMKNNCDDTVLHISDRFDESLMIQKHRSATQADRNKSCKETVYNQSSDQFEKLRKIKGFTVNFNSPMVLPLYDQSEAGKWARNSIPEKADVGIVEGYCNQRRVESLHSVGDERSGNFDVRVLKALL